MTRNRRRQLREGAEEEQKGTWPRLPVPDLLFSLSFLSLGGRIRVVAALLELVKLCVVYEEGDEKWTE